MSIAIAVPLPPPSAWRVLGWGEACPSGHAVILTIDGRPTTRGKRAAVLIEGAPEPGTAEQLPDALDRTLIARLIAALAHLKPEQREHVVLYAEELAAASQEPVTP